MKWISLLILLLLTTNFNERTRAQEQPVRASTIWMHEFDSAIQDVSWSPDNQHILVLVVSAVYVLDASTGDIELQLEISQNAQAASWNSTGSQFAVRQWWNEPVQIVDFPSGTIHLFDAVPTIRISWHPTHESILLTGGVERSGNGIGMVWDTVEATLVERLPDDGAYNYVQAVWDTEAQHLFVPSGVGAVLIFNAQTWELERRLELYNEWQRIFSVIPNSDSTKLLITRYDESGILGVSILDLESESELATLDISTEDLIYPDTLRGLGWSPDGGYVWTEVYDGFVEIWDAVTYGKVLQVSALSNRLRQISWSADSYRVLVANGKDVGGRCEEYGCPTTAQIVEVETGAITHILRGHHEAVTFAYWNQNETRVITGSEDGTVRLWDLTQESDYTGCDITREFIPGEFLTFNPPFSDEQAAFLEPAITSDVIEHFVQGDEIIIWDGPICIDGVDWYRVYHPLRNNEEITRAAWIPTNDQSSTWLERTS